MKQREVEESTWKVMRIIRGGDEMWDGRRNKRGEVGGGRKDKVTAAGICARGWGMRGRRGRSEEENDEKFEGEDFEEEKCEE